jgi:chemotaxis family two-component system response regulator Rcp1
VNTPRPDLVLPDLNLPRLDGRQFLARIKGDADLNMIPRVILTTSRAKVDIEKSYQLQANCCLSKPLELGEFDSIVTSISDFWLTRAELPCQRLFA